MELSGDCFSKDHRDSFHGYSHKLKLLNEQKCWGDRELDPLCSTRFPSKRDTIDDGLTKEVTFQAGFDIFCLDSV